MSAVLLDPPLNADAFLWLVRSGETLIGAGNPCSWAIQRFGDSPRIVDAQRYMMLLPILELSPTKFNDFLTQQSLLVPSFAEAILAFPERALLRHALTATVSSYWPNLAIQWISARPQLKNELQDAMIALSKNPLMTQSLKHQTKRLIAADWQ